jgi:hypothetical protein
VLGTGAAQLPTRGPQLGSVVHADNLSIALAAISAQFHPNQIAIPQLFYPQIATAVIYASRKIVSDSSGLPIGGTELNFLPIRIDPLHRSGDFISGAIRIAILTSFSVAIEISVAPVIVPGVRIGSTD